jgi:hypothetical protein
MITRQFILALTSLFLALLALTVWFFSPTPPPVAGPPTTSSNAPLTPHPIAKQDAPPSLAAELHDARVDAARKEAELLELQRQLKTETEQPPKPAPWLRDPEMIKVLQSDAKSAATRSARALLEGGLSQHLQLTEEQTHALEQLLIARNSIVWETMLLPLTAGELDPAARSAAGRATKQAVARNAEEIRALVGPEGFKSFQWYEQTQPDRDQVQRFAPQFTQAGQALDADQQSQLLAIMIEERTRLPKLQEFGDPMTIDYEHWDENFTDEKVAAYFQQMTQFNDRIAQRAQLMLTPEQTNLLRQYHAEHLRRSQFTVRNTKLMMGQKK